jgi:hypothetical protein
MRRWFPKGLQAFLILVVLLAVAHAEKTCPSCGTSNRDSDRFCKSCGGKLPEAQPSRPAPPRVAGSVSVTGSVVSISSEPLGATVTVDGKNRGRTPLELTDLGPGRHEVEIARSGYRTYYSDFTIAGLFGSMVVTTDPVGAEVLLDGQSRGRAGEAGLALTRVPYGRHNVTARLDGYNDVVKAVDLVSVGPIGVVMKLGYGKGLLLVESEPGSADLLMNSRSVGKTPYSAELVPARYVLTLTRRGFYDWVGYADVQYAETSRVRATLDRMQTRKLPILLLGVAGLAAGAGSAVMGESEYARYQAASSPEDAARYRQSTEAWDMRRNIAFGAGVLLSGLYLVVRW